MPDKFTPGPWKTDGRHTIWTDRPWDINDVIAVAINSVDAILIAEAPAMLALIKKALAVDAGRTGDCPCELCEAARAIIARVEKGSEHAQ